MILNTENILKLLHKTFGDVTVGSDQNPKSDRAYARIMNVYVHNGGSRISATSEGKDMNEAVLNLFKSLMNSAYVEVFKGPFSTIKYIWDGNQFMKINEPADILKNRTISIPKSPISKKTRFDVLEI